MSHSLLLSTDHFSVYISIIYLSIHLTIYLSIYSSFIFWPICLPTNTLLIYLLSHHVHSSSTFYHLLFVSHISYICRLSLPSFFMSFFVHICHLLPIYPLSSIYYLCVSLSLCQFYNKERGFFICMVLGTLQETLLLC